MNKRRETSKEYKERRLRGGVYTITNTVNGKYIIGHAADLASVQNRFQFSVLGFTDAISRNQRNTAA